MLKMRDGSLAKQTFDDLLYVKVSRSFLELFPMLIRTSGITRRILRFRENGTRKYVQCASALLISNRLVCISLLLALKILLVLMYDLYTIPNVTDFIHPSRGVSGIM
jgi:hypothetical protein